MKAPDHERPSGDRTMARQFLRLLEELGHDVEIASALRTWEAGDEERQEASPGGVGPGKRTPSHPLAGPSAAGVVHLSSLSQGARSSRTSHRRCPRQSLMSLPNRRYRHAQANGRWRRPWAHARAAIERADTLLPITLKDERGLLAAGLPRRKIMRLPPFIDATDVSTRERGCTPRPCPGLRFRRGPRHRRHRGHDAPRRQARGPTGSWPGPSPRWTARTCSSSSSATARHGARSNTSSPDVPSSPGIIDEHSIRHIMAGCDLFVWPAINEAYGMAILLAQACGCPVAAGDAPGVGEIVNHGCTGLLAPPGDAASLAHAVSRLLDDPVLRRSLGDAGRRHVRRHHSLRYRPARSRSRAGDAAVKLALLRHAPTTWNEAGRIQGLSDIHLSRAGRAAARTWRLPDRLHGWRRLSSPLLRALETAALAGLRDPEIDPRLREMDWGDWEGETLDSSAPCRSVGHGHQRGSGSRLPTVRRRKPPGGPPPTPRSCPGSCG